MGAGAILNAVAFSGSNSLFSMFSGSDAESCNKALAQLQIDKKKWAEKWAQLADLANAELQRQGHSLQSFKSVEEAFNEYNSLTNIDLKADLGKEPSIADYYQTSDSTK